LFPVKRKTAEIGKKQLGRLIACKSVYKLLRRINWDEAKNPLVTQNIHVPEIGPLILSCNEQKINLSNLNFLSKGFVELKMMWYFLSF